MRGLLVVAGFCAAVLASGCSQSVSPTAPSAHADALSLSGAVTAGAGTSAASAAARVPFKGSLEGQYGTPSGAFPLIQESIAATGHAAQLGRYTLAIEETVNLLTATAVGTFTFTAANGDTVFGNYTGQAQLGALISIVENAVVLGGTGRFTGAAGVFTINRLYDPATRTTTGSFDGAISSPGIVHE